MVSITQSSHDKMLREIADRYIRKGYAVQIQPSDDQLPDFLRGYRPDMIVTTPDDNMVVEVNSKSKVRQSNYWEQLKGAIDMHPGWRLQFVMNSKREEELRGLDQTILSDQEIQTRLQAAQNLADSGLLDSALLVVWSTLEATLRQIGRADGLELPNQGAAPLITTLYTNGDLEREDYDSLMEILEARNQAAHGFRVENLNRSLFDKAQQIARSLKK